MKGPLGKWKRRPRCSRMCWTRSQEGMRKRSNRSLFAGFLSVLSSLLCSLLASRPAARACRSSGRRNSTAQRRSICRKRVKLANSCMCGKLEGWCRPEKFASCCQRRGTPSTGFENRLPLTYSRTKLQPSSPCFLITENANPRTSSTT